MTVLVLASGIKPHFYDCVTSLRERSRCNVVVVNSVQDVVKDSIHCPLNALKIPKQIVRTKRFSQVRWLMAEWILSKTKLEPPFYFPDWDDIILHNISDHINALKDFDVLRTQDNGHCPSAAKVFWSYDMLCGYIEFVRKMCRKLEAEWHLSDMNTWHKFCTTRGLKTSNLSQDIGFGVFDHNMHTGGDVFETDDEGRKLIEWHNYKPYFVTIDDGKRVAAESIHCWGTYKTMTNELLRHAGIS